MIYLKTHATYLAAYDCLKWCAFIQIVIKNVIRQSVNCVKNIAYFSLEHKAKDKILPVKPVTFPFTL